VALVQGLGFDQEIPHHSTFSKNRHGRLQESKLSYLQEVEQQSPVEEPVHTQDQVSTTDPDSTYATKVAPRLGCDTTIIT
jgi:hypothetical protein